MSRGCEDCDVSLSAISVYRCGLEAGVRRAAHLNTSEAWGKVAALKVQVGRIEQLWARHCREAHGL